MDFTSGFPRETASSQETSPGSPAPFQGDPRNVTFLKHRTSNTSQSRPSESASIPRRPSLPRSKDPKWARENVTWIACIESSHATQAPRMLRARNRRWLCNKRLGQFLNGGLRPLHCCSKRAHGVDYTMVPSRFETGWLPVSQVRTLPPGKISQYMAFAQFESWNSRDQSELKELNSP